MGRWREQTRSFGIHGEDVYSSFWVTIKASESVCIDRVISEGRPFPILELTKAHWKYRPHLDIRFLKLKD